MPEFILFYLAFPVPWLRRVRQRLRPPPHILARPEISSRGAHSPSWRVCREHLVSANCELAAEACFDASFSGFEITFPGSPSFLFFGFEEMLGL
jgi:hypothetical protein